MAILYTDYISIDHYAPWYSRQALITWLFALVTIFLPFVLIVPTHSKLLRIKSFRFLGYWDIHVWVAVSAPLEWDSCCTLHALKNLHVRLHLRTK